MTSEMEFKIDQAIAMYDGDSDSEEARVSITRFWNSTFTPGSVLASPAGPIPVFHAFQFDDDTRGAFTAYGVLKSQGKL